MLKALEEFYSYIQNKRDFISNYGERHRHGVNNLISKRFVKRSQMRQPQPGPHLLLQVRVQVIN